MLDREVQYSKTPCHDEAVVSSDYVKSRVDPLLGRLSKGHVAMECTTVYGVRERSVERLCRPGN